MHTWKSVDTVRIEPVPMVKTETYKYGIGYVLGNTVDNTIDIEL